MVSFSASGPICLPFIPLLPRGFEGMMAAFGLLILPCRHLGKTSRCPKMSEPLARSQYVTSVSSFLSRTQLRIFSQEHNFMLASTEAARCSTLLLDHLT